MAFVRFEFTNGSFRTSEGSCMTDGGSGLEAGRDATPRSS